MDTITDDLKTLHAPPALKRWKEIWKHELEINQEPSDSINQRKKRKSTVRSKRKHKKSGRKK